MTEKIKFGRDTVFRMYDSDGYKFFIITSGTISEDLGDCFAITHKLKVRKLKWVADRTVLLPIDDFKDRKFFYVDHYVLAIDETEKEFNWRSNLFGYIKLNSICNKITNVLKLVKYAKFEDKHKNYDKKEHTKISTDNN
jgi:hypothetical protein